MTRDRDESRSPAIVPRRGCAHVDEAVDLDGSWTDGEEPEVRETNPRTEPEAYTGQDARDAEHTANARCIQMV
jgi:hypothetical protein